MLEGNDRKSDTKSKSGSGKISSGITVVSKGDFGVPNPVLYERLKPINRDACVLRGAAHFSLVKGQQYEFNGTKEEIETVYPKGHQKAGEPCGLNTLFEVK